MSNIFIDRLMFGDQVGPRRTIASALGFAGSLLVIQPAFADFGAVALYPLGTAVFFAFYMLVTRALSREVKPIAMQFHTALIAAVICIPVLWFYRDGGFADFRYVQPEGWIWVWLVGVGVARGLQMHPRCRGWVPMAPVPGVRMPAVVQRCCARCLNDPVRARES